MDTRFAMDTREHVSARLRRLDRSEITTIVRRALEDDRVEVDRWEVRPRDENLGSLPEESFDNPMKSFRRI